MSIETVGTSVPPAAANPQCIYDPIVEATRPLVDFAQCVWNDPTNSLTCFPTTWQQPIQQTVMFLGGTFAVASFLWILDILLTPAPQPVPKSMFLMPLWNGADPKAPAARPPQVRPNVPGHQPGSKPADLFDFYVLGVSKEKA